MQIKFIQTLIDKIRGKNLSNISIKKLQNNFDKKIKKLKNKNKIKVAFLHMYATDIQNLTIFDAMLQDDYFEPFFIVNPDVSRSKENFDYQYKRSLEELRKKYGNNKVLEGYNYVTNSYIDYTKEFDIATTNNPYDLMSHKFFKISYWAKKNIPMFYISYFYMGRCHVSIDNLKMPQFSYLWKFFAENDYVLELAKKYEILKGNNIVVTGSPKMDKLATINIDSNNRNNILKIVYLLLLLDIFYVEFVIVY